MPIQIVGAPNRGPSQGQRLNQGLGQALQQGSEMFENYQNQQKLSQQMQAENETAKKMGFSLEGIQDPKIRQEIISQELQGRRAMELEKLKQGGKQSRQKEEQDFLGNLFGGQGQSQDMGNRLQQGEPQGFEDFVNQGPSQMQEPRQERKPFNAADVSDEAILKLTAINQALGKAVEHAKEVALRQENERKKLEQDERNALKKEIGSSYTENKDYINKTYDLYEDSLRKDAILERMGVLDESGELSNSGMINALESIGLKPEWLKNPANEEYTKLALDLLGGGSLQADYGSRVLASEFKVSQQRIPTLNQTPEGRKQIRENIKAMLLPAQLKKERMQYYLDKSEKTGQPLPHNLRAKILQDIKPQLEEAYDKFKQRNGRYPVKKGTIPDDDTLEKYYYISDGNVEKASKMMSEDGYNVK